MLDGQPFAIAAIWEPATDSDRVCVLTTESNDLIAAIHDRMPVIVAREDYARWLDPASDPNGLKELLRPFPVGRMKMYPVNPALNKSGYDAPDCAEPWDEHSRADTDIQSRLF